MGLGRRRLPLAVVPRRARFVAVLEGSMVTVADAKMVSAELPSASTPAGLRATHDTLVLTHAMTPPTVARNRMGRSRSRSAPSVHRITLGDTHTQLAQLCE